MRVAIFTDTFLPEVNGVAQTLGKWVRYLEAQGIPCKVFAPESGLEGSSNYEYSMVERFYSIPFLLYPNCKLAIPRPLQLQKQLASFRPTLIHVATPFNLGLFGLYYSRKHSIPLVASYHTHFDQYLAYYRLQWMEPLLWKYMLWFHQDCRQIWVPSRSALLHLQAKGFQQLDIWGRGVDTERFRPSPQKNVLRSRLGLDPESFIYLYVGRIAPEKSVDVLLEAFQRLPASMREKSRLLLAGDGPQYRVLQDQYGSDPRIRLLGFVRGEALRDLYAAANVFVFPSATETFGNVVLEAMASGTPVIGADAGGVADNINHGQNGWLCTPGDPESFTNAMITLQDQPLVRDVLSAMGRKYAIRQSWTYIFDRLLESYKEADAVFKKGQNSERLIIEK
jgi:glycosyltransferase involved in cell wall biosynthesis